MPNFKIVVSDPKSKKAYQKEVDQTSSGLVGKKIGEQIDGGSLGLSGYKLEITGGSDKDGFPMRKDVEGIGRKKIILASGPGFHPERKGERKRKSIRGNTISADIAQINTKVVSYGQKGLEEIFGVKEKKKEEKAEHKKEEVKIEKPAEKKETEAQPKPKEEAKEKPHAEVKKEEHKEKHVEGKDEQKLAEAKRE